MTTMDDVYKDKSNHIMCDSCGLCVTCGDCLCDTTETKCPHCGSTEGTWFDRTIVINGSGEENEYESMPYRCNSCGKNVDAPVGYYEDKEFLGGTMADGIIEVEFKRDICFKVRHVPGNPPEITSITIKGLGDDFCINQDVKTRLTSLTNLSEDLAWERQDELEEIIDDYRKAT